MSYLCISSAILLPGKMAGVIVEQSLFLSLLCCYWSVTAAMHGAKCQCHFVSQFCLFRLFFEDLYFTRA